MPRSFGAQSRAAVGAQRLAKIQFYVLFFEIGLCATRSRASELTCVCTNRSTRVPSQAYNSHTWSR